MTQKAVPVAWIRFCSDGCYEGPIMDCAMEDVRKKSGAWTPLYAAPVDGGRADGMEEAAKKTSVNYAIHAGAPKGCKCADCRDDEPCPICYRVWWQAKHSSTEFVCADDSEVFAANQRAKTAESDAARYRWLRDTSVPPHNFYLSVPIEFKDERYQPHQVDAEIDAAIRAAKGE